MSIGLVWKNPDLMHVGHTTIHEYDISAAGITAMQHQGQYLELANQLSRLPKQDRVIREGLAISKDPAIDRVIKNGLNAMISEFCRANDLNITNVIATRRDSVTFFGNSPNIVDIGPAKWRKVGEWHSYHRFKNGLETMMTLTGQFNSKGFNQTSLEMHRPFMLEFIKNFTAQEFSDRKQLLPWISDFRKRYLNFEIQAGYYREFNMASQFRSKTTLANQTIMFDNCPPDANMIDPGYNYLTIILPLIQYSH